MKNEEKTPKETQTEALNIADVRRSACVITDKSGEILWVSLTESDAKNWIKLMYDTQVWTDLKYESVPVV